MPHGFEIIILSLLFPHFEFKSQFLPGLETPIHKYQVATYESQRSPESLFIPY